MARLARLVVPGLPHHVTQRGNGRARTFFDDDDYALYRDLLAEQCRAADVAVWAWCLMPNHAHLILVPADADGLRRALAATHRRYAGIIHARRKRTGHFWQGRFGSVVMDEEHLAAAVRYVSLNPVRARLAARPQDWRWSSVRAHLSGRDDGLTTLAPVLERFAPFRAFLEEPADRDAIERLRAAESIGRPLGTAAFVARLEKRSGRTLRPAKRGPKSRRNDPAQL
jgi:REP-associated tyrosine transposase